MVCFPHCKINIGLNVVAKRNDGYHDLETAFYPVKCLYDVLEIVPASRYTLHQTGIVAAADAEDNLVTKAFRLLQCEYGLKPVTVHLHKVIPHGAGLGGGSADAAFMLTSLNAFFALGLTQQQLLGYALPLGSDCPFFIHNTACYAQGRGEQLQPIPLNLSGTIIVMLRPNIHVSTADAFKGIMPKASGQNLTSALQFPDATWRGAVHNDFEKTTFMLSPEFAQAKQILYDAGAYYASLTGTGSVVYGLFAQPVTPLRVPADWWQYQGML